MILQRCCPRNNRKPILRIIIFSWANNVYSFFAYLSTLSTPLSYHFPSLKQISFIDFVFLYGTFECVCCFYYFSTDFNFFLNVKKVANAVMMMVFQHMRSVGKCQEKLDQYRIQGLKSVSTTICTHRRKTEGFVLTYKLKISKKAKIYI